MTEVLPAADGFQVRDSDLDFHIQQALSRTLENCRQVSPLYPTLGEMYPELTGIPTAEQRRWLGPVLRRLDWNLRENPRGEDWAPFFGPMTEVILRSANSASEEELSILCERAAFLRKHNCHHVLDKIAGFACHWDGELPEALVDRLRQVRAVFDQPGTSRTANYALGWALFRAAHNQDDGDPCWSAEVRRDLRAMPDKQRARWMTLLDANEHQLQVARALSKAASKALAAVGSAEFAEVLDRWTRMLAAKERLELSSTGATLFNFLTALCLALPEAEIDESLYRIAGAKWAEPPGSSDWIPAYLQAISSRESRKAFACAEALMMNPATKNFQEVANLYNTLAQASVGATGAEGVDGFRSPAGDPLGAEHAQIDSYLRAVLPPRPEAGRPSLHSLDQGSSQRASVIRSAPSLPRLAEAIAERTLFLSGHRDEYTEEQWVFWRVGIGNLLGEVVAKLDDASLLTLKTIFRADASGTFGCFPSMKLLDLAEQYVAKNGWNPELTEAMRPWVKAQYGSNSAMDVRRKAGWFMWFDETDPIKLDECWSYRIRADLRRMPEGERKLWLGLLSNSSFATADKPPAKWLKPARELFRKMEPAQFRDRYRSWFGAFHEESPLRLTVPGRDVLRLLMWYALLAEDPAVDQALAWFGEAKWKTKDAANRAAIAETAFSHVLPARNPELARAVFGKMVESGRGYEGSKIHKAYQELCAKAGEAAAPARAAAPKGPDPETLNLKMTAQMKQVMVQNVEGASWDGDVLSVQAGGDVYKIDAVSGRVTRASDGAAVRVEIPFEKPQYGHFRAMIDGHDLRNPGQPNYMRAVMCAMVLKREPGAAVVDSTV